MRASTAAATLLMLGGLWYGARKLAAWCPPMACERPPVAAPKLAATPVAKPAQPLELPQTPDFSAADNAMMQRIYGAFATGDFVGALALADDQTAQVGLSDAFQEWLKRQLPVLLASAAWSRLKLGDCEQAIPWFRRAAFLQRSPEVTKGLAVCYYKQKNMIAAHEEFLLYLDGSPNDAEMLLLYADVLESEGRYGAAVEVLRQLVAMAGTAGIDKAALQQRLDSMQGREQESTLEQTESSRNFRLTFRGGEHEDLVSFVLTSLEDAFDEYHEAYSLPAPPTPIEVVLYPAAAFRSVVTYGPPWAEGLYDGRLRIPVKDAMQTPDYAELEVVLRHELVHALLALVNDSRTLPPWFDEGMAQRLSCANRDCVNFHFPPTPGGFLPESSFRSSYLTLSALNAGRAYQQSLFMIMTIEALKGDHALRQILTSVSTHSDVTSDGLLAPVGLTFAGLHGAASDFWNRRVVPLH